MDGEILSVTRVRHGLETFFITLARHLAQPARKAAIERAFPSSVLAPVLIPP